MHLTAALRPLLRWDSDFRKLFFRIVIPIALQNLVSASMHIVDNIMVGGVGEAEYAGVIQANKITFLAQLFIFGVVSGAGIFAAQFWGKQDLPWMRRVQGLALRLACGLGLLFTLGVVCFGRQIMLAFLVPGPSFEFALQYLMIIAPFYALTALDSVFAMMLKCSERARVPMTAGVCAILTNTVLNYGLIYGKLGLPQLGVQGAAIATVIAGFVSLAINVGVSYGKKLAPAASLSELRLPDRAFTVRFFRTIAPVVLNEGLWALGTTLYAMTYGHMGDEVVAAMGIVSTIDQLLFVLGYGIMHAASVIVGRSLGAGRLEEAFLYAKRVLGATVVCMMVMGGVLLLLRGVAVSPFTISDAAKDMAKSVMLISAFFLFIRGFNAVNVVGVLRSGGDTVFSLLLDICSLWLVGAPLAALAGLVLHWPIQWVYLITQLEELFKTCVGLPRFLSKKWIRNLVADV